MPPGAARLAGRAMSIGSVLRRTLLMDQRVTRPRRCGSCKVRNLLAAIAKFRIDFPSGDGKCGTLRPDALGKSLVGQFHIAFPLRPQACRSVRRHVGSPESGNRFERILGRCELTCDHAVIDEPIDRRLDRRSHDALAGRCSATIVIKDGPVVLVRRTWPTSITFSVRQQSAHFGVQPPQFRRSELVDVGIKRPTDDSIA